MGWADRTRLPFPDSFWAKINKHGPWPKKKKNWTPTSPCHIWTGATDGRVTGAYGRFLLPDGKQGRTHIIAYELTYGPILEGMKVCHHCDVTLCCNVAHLFLSTQAGNVKDMDTKGRGNRVIHLLPSVIKRNAERKAARLVKLGSAKLCTCGCGVLAPLGKLWIKGHNRRGNKYQRRLIVSLHKHGFSDAKIAKKFEVSVAIIQGILKNPRL